MKKIKGSALMIVALLACLSFVAIKASAQNNNMNSSMPGDQMKSSATLKKHRMMRRRRMRRRHRMMMRKRSMMMKKPEMMKTPDSMKSPEMMKKNP